MFDQIFNTEKGLENTTRSEVVLTQFEAFRNVDKHCFERLKYLLNQIKN